MIGEIFIKLDVKKVIPALPEYANIKRLILRAFPANERFPMFMLMLLSLKKDVDFSAYYDKGRFCGITYSVENEHMLYVMYLAVNDKIRGKGYGTAILDKLKEKCKNKPIALEAEFPSENSVNLAQRLKRLKFYRKNGFSDTRFILSSGGEKYMILCDTDKFTLEDYTQILKALSYGLYKPKIEREESAV